MKSLLMHYFPSLYPKLTTNQSPVVGARHNPAVFSGSYTNYHYTWVGASGIQTVGKSSYLVIGKVMGIICIYCDLNHLSVITRAVVCIVNNRRNNMFVFVHSLSMPHFVKPPDDVMLFLTNQMKDC